MIGFVWDDVVIGVVGFVVGDCWGEVGVEYVFYLECDFEDIFCVDDVGGEIE